MILETLPSNVIWLGLGMILCMAELIVPGVFLLWIGVAALIVGALASVVSLAWPVEVLLFGLVSVASVFAGRRWSSGQDIVSDDPMLNDRLARLVGQQVVVVEPITGGRGRVRVGDGVWPASGTDAAIDTRMVITGARDGVLTVALL